MPARTQAKQKKLGDYIDVWFKDVGDGIAAKVYRTDESDAEWEAKKAQASSRAKGSPAEWKSMPEKVDSSKDEIILQGGKVRIPRGPLSDKEWADRVRTASERKDWDSYTYNGKQVTPRGKTVEDWTPEETRTTAQSLNQMDEDYKKRVEADEAEGPAPKTFSTKEEAEAWAKKTGVPAPAAYAVINDKVHEIQPAKVVPSDGNPDIKPAQVIESEPKGAGFSVKNPLGIAMEAIKGAVPQQTVDFAESEAPPTVALNSEGSNPPLNAAAAKQANMQFYGNDPGAATAQAEAQYGMSALPPPPANPSFADVAGDVAGFFNPGTGLAPVLNAAMSPAPEMRDADPLDAPKPPPPVPPGGSYPGLGLPPVPGTGSAGGGASVAGEAKMPGFGYKPMLVDEKPLKDAAAAYNETVTGALREQNAMADEHRAMAADITQKNLEAMAVSDELTKQQIARQQTVNAEQTRMMSAYQSKMDEQERVSAQGIDPGRFWANKSAGQKAAAVIAGALFGFTGQGMQWLQRLDGLVAEDNRLQESDLNRKIAGLDRSAKGLLTQVDFLDKTATRDIAMLELGKAQKYKEAEMYLRNFALTTQSMEMKQKALTMTEMLASKQFEVQQNLTQLAHQNAAALNQARAHSAAQAAEMYKFKVAQDAKTAGGGYTGPELKPVEKENMAEMQTWADGLNRMISDYKGVRGDSWAATGAVSSAVGGVTGKSTASSRWKDSVVRWAQILGKPLEGGVVREEDSKRYEKSYIPSVSEVDEAAAQKMQDLAKYAISKYTNMYNSHRAVDAQGWRSFKPPEVFAQEVLSTLGGGGGGVPGERAR